MTTIKVEKQQKLFLHKHKLNSIHLFNNLELLSWIIASWPKAALRISTRGFNLKRNELVGETKKTLHFLLVWNLGHLWHIVQSMEGCVDCFVLQRAKTLPPRFPSVSLFIFFAHEKKLRRKPKINKMSRRIFIILGGWKHFMHRVTKLCRTVSKKWLELLQIKHFFEFLRISLISCDAMCCQVRLFFFLIFIMFFPKVEIKRKKNTRQVWSFFSGLLRLKIRFNVSR